MILRAWIAFCLLPSSAFAWCTATPPANPSSGPATQLPHVAMACWPSAGGISGSGRGFLQKDFPPVPGATVQGGSAWGWWCQKSDLTWSAQTMACLDKYCPGTAVKAAAAALASSSPGSALQKIIDSYVVRVPDGQEANDYNCLHWDMLQALQATKPATAPAWSVYPSGSSVYPIVNGKLGAPISGKRAVGGTTCDCAIPIVQFGYTYCAYQGGATGQVAMCVKP